MPIPATAVDVFAELQAFGAPSRTTVPGPPTTEPTGSDITPIDANGVTMCPRCGDVASARSRFCPSCGSALSASTEIGVDHLLTRLRQATQGEYDVLREVGHGGMAAVYLAWDRELARYVAIKVLLPELAYDPTMSQRFLQEARTAANLDDHPSVVRVYRAKEAQGLRYFVMKYVDGCSLEQLLRSAGPLPPDLATHIVDQAAHALQYAHEHGVVHRDVKPGNILLDRAGGVVVTDFGIAKVAEAEQLTRTGFAIGTPHYMSPEQWRVEPLTPASDQYALGVVAYQIATGEVPFDGTQYHIQEQHLHAEPPNLSTHRDGIPAAFGAVVRVMLGKSPTERFPDLRSVSQALSAIPRDATPVLRDRLARLIPTANALAVPALVTHESDPPVERANGRDGGTAGHPGATPAFPTPNAARAPLGALMAAPPVTPPTALPSAPQTSAAWPPEPVLGLTTSLRPPTSITPASAAPLSAVAPSLTSPVASPAASMQQVATVREANADAPNSGDVAHPPRLVGPISRLDGPSRTNPWLVTAAVILAAVGIGTSVAVHNGFDWGSAATADSTRRGRAHVISAPAITPTKVAQLPAIAGGSDTTAAGVRPAVPRDTGAGKQKADTTVPLGPAANVTISGAPRDKSLTMTVGDSVPLAAQVFDANRHRLRDARVGWSVDAGHLALHDTPTGRGHVLVALERGGPYTVTARAGAAMRTLRVIVTERAGTPALRAPLSAAEAEGEVEAFASALGARDMRLLGSRFRLHAYGGRDVADWLDGLPELSTGAPVVGDIGEAGGRPVVAFNIKVRWRTAAHAPLQERTYGFWMTFTRDDRGGWHGSEVIADLR